MIFSVERLVIRFLLPEFFTGSLPGQVLIAMIVGLRFDIVIAAILTSPLIALVIAGPLFTRLRFQQFISALIALVLDLVVFSCIADFYFFGQFGERLNHKALVYLDSDYVYKIIWKDYPIVTIILVCCVMGLFLYRVICWAIAARIQSAAVPLLSKGQVVFLMAVMICLATVGIRGTLGPKAINTGPAYFCSSASMAQLTLNGLFTLREAVVNLNFREEKIDKYYTLLPPQQALKNTVDLIARPGEHFRTTDQNPLRRITDTGRSRHDYNVVLVVLESLSWHYIGAMGSSPGYTPNLDRLIGQGLFMDKCFAVGNRTTRGFSAVISSYPDLPGKSVSTRPQTEGTFLTLGSVLKSRGYKTLFIYAGQPSYDHRQAFLGSNGYTHMVFKDDFATHIFKGELGFCDEDLYNQTLLEMEKCQDEPFFATLLTLSFHRSWKIPAGKIALEPSSTHFHDQIDAIRYTDWAIGQFMEKASAIRCFNDTIFVFVADHMGGFKEKPTTAASYRIPFLVYAPQIVKPDRMQGICSQLDIAPTIMHLLGGTYEHCFFGSSVIDRQPGTGFAWMLNGQQVIYIDGVGQVAVISPNNQSTFFKFSLPNTLEPLDSGVSTVQLAQMPISILQVAADIYKNEAHNITLSSAQAMDPQPVINRDDPSQE